MSTNFDPARSAAIRTALVDEATPTIRQRRPWRGLALVLAGVLAGSGATTAAFANGRLPMEPTTAPGEGQTIGTRIVVVEGEGAPTFIEDDADEKKLADGLAQARRLMAGMLTIDAKTGELHIDYRSADKLREVGREEMVVTEPSALDLSGHPAEATLAWVTFSCEGGAVDTSDADQSQVRGEPADGEEPREAAQSEDPGDAEDEAPDDLGTVVVQVMINLTDSTNKIAHGCVGRATVIYYAES